MYHFVVKVKKNLGPEFFKIKLQSLIYKYCVLGKYKLCPCSTSLLLASNNICFLYFKKSSDTYAKQKHPGCKKSARPIRSSIANRCDQNL